jgi:hypothetical protein
MKPITVFTVRNATQAKLVLNPWETVIKIPGFLNPEQRLELRDKLIKIADLNSESREFLKLYYKIGTPYFFLNRKVGPRKKETISVYKYDEL